MEQTFLFSDDEISLLMDLLEYVAPNIHKQLLPETQTVKGVQFANLKTSESYCLYRIAYEVIPFKFRFKWNQSHSNKIYPVYELGNTSEYVQTLYDYIKETSLNFTVKIGKGTAL